MRIEPAGISQKQVFGIRNAQEFNEMALRIFQFQKEKNQIYRSFLLNLGRPEPEVWKEIPCLPISAFKSGRILTDDHPVEIHFESSGTSGENTSKHYLYDLSWYRKSFLKFFEQQYGHPEELCILGLLPSYLERGNSSLVYMVQDLIKRSRFEESGFYLDNREELRKLLLDLKEKKQKTILFAVPFSLLDFIEEGELDFPELIIIETGGMKGRRKELIREDLHNQIIKGFGVKSVHSEYGMTELLSQAYSQADGLFDSPPWMQIAIRNVNDPFEYLGPNKTGGINVIDLANVHSCSFIATDDLGRIHGQDQFEVLGRFDHSDIRGCSLLI